MGRPRTLKKKDRYPFSDKNCLGGSAKKGLRRQIKDGDITITEAGTMVWGEWKRYERNNKFSQWLRRKKKTTKKK